MSEKIVQSAVMDEVKEILETISTWHGMFPTVADENGKEWSYGAAYGSNGERDFMRELANKALILLSAAPTPPGAEHNWLTEEAAKAVDATKDWPQWRKDAATGNDQPDSAAPEPVAWMHSKREFDVVHDKAKKIVHDSFLAHGFHSYVQRPSVDKSEFYTIPLYLHPPSQRITEQDAREIITAYVLWRGTEYNQVMADKFSAAFFTCEQGLDLLAKLNENREPDYKARALLVKRAGQINVGDTLSFELGGRQICTTAKEVLNAGTNREEIIYNRKKNHYFITSMVIDGTSTHKNVFVVPAAIAKHEGGK